jgi:hypothetical protein
LPTPGNGTYDTAALVREAPEFLGMDSQAARRFIAVPANPADQGGTRLMLVVDDAGGIALAGCPTKTDCETCTAMARGIVELQARMWRMSSEQFFKTFQAGPGKTLAAAMVEKVGSEFSELTFRAGIDQSLAQGMFPVFVVLHSLDTEAADALAYLRSLNLSVKGFGVDLYESWGVEVALPKLLTTPEAPRPDAAEKPKPVARPMPPPTKPTPQPAASPRPPGPATAVPQTARPATTQTQPTPKPAEVRPTEAASPRPEPQFQIQPEPEPPPQNERRVWDGTRPGVMAGRRPPPKPPDDGAAPKGK